jgi:hypothetical protein
MHYTAREAQGRQNMRFLCTPIVLSAPGLSFELLNVFQLDDDDVTLAMDGFYYLRHGGFFLKVKTSTYRLDYLNGFLINLDQI